MTEALGHYGERITRVEAHLSDANSLAKANTDEIHCTLETRLVGLDPVIVKERAGTAHQAPQQLRRALAVFRERGRCRSAGDGLLRPQPGPRIHAGRCVEKHAADHDAAVVDGALKYPLQGKSRTTRTAKPSDQPRGNTQLISSHHETAMDAPANSSVARQGRCADRPPGSATLEHFERWRNANPPYRPASGIKSAERNCT